MHPFPKPGNKIRQETKEEFEVSILTFSPTIDRSEQEAVGRTTIKKKFCKYWLNTMDKQYSRRIIQNSIVGQVKIKK